MACMEHWCSRCDWFGADNAYRASCPVCGTSVSNDFDEWPEREEEDE